MEFEIKGDNLPVVIFNLKSGENIVTESGGMSWMSPNMKMETTSFGGMKSGLRRMFAGEKFFRNIYTADGDGMIAFASKFPGQIKAFDLSHEKIIFQRSSYIASQDTVTTSLYFHKKVSTTLFGGEAFFMQKAEGEGYIFLEFDGRTVEYELEEGQQIIVEPAYLAAMSEGCHMEIVSVKGLKNKIFGGEGLFNTIITGPGKVYIQSMPIPVVARAIDPFITRSTNTTINTSSGSD